MLAIVSCAMLLLAVLPGKWIRWETWIAERPATIILGPLQQPIRSAVGWFRRPGGDRAENPQVADLKKQLEEVQTRLLNEQSQNDGLRRQITELQKGLALNPDVPRQLFAPIIGGGADLSGGYLKAKAGSREGVEVGSVAVVGGVNLVGRVRRVPDPYCLILPITERAAGSIRGVVMLTDDERGSQCEFIPTGDGALRGKAEWAPNKGEPKVGMVVRLDDPNWPATSRMLVLGHVESVETAANQRKIVIVRPEVPLDTVSEVVLRIPETGGEGVRP
jgi:cell shape-determining protein MreC